MRAKATIWSVRWHSLALTCALTFAMLASTTGGFADAASSSSAVGVTVASATIIDGTLCPSQTLTKTAFGTVTVSSSNVTSADCTVTFGSSNDSAKLIAYQADGAGTSMVTTTATTTEVRGEQTDGWLGFDSASASIGWVVGGHGRVYKTTDGGSSWSQQSVGFANASIYDIESTSTSDATLVGTVSGKVYHTSNGGTNWTAATLSPTTSNSFYQIDMYDASTGWMVGAGGKVYKTTDGGVNWTGQTSTVTDTLYGVKAISASIVVATGSAHRIIRTTDGGTNWASVYSFGANNFDQIEQIGSDLITIGDCTCGDMLRSTDSGATWTPVADPDASGIWNDVNVIGSNLIVVGAGGDVITSTDGISWAPVDSSAPASWSLGFVGAFTATDGLIGGEALLMAASTDAGATWADSFAGSDLALWGVAAFTESTVVNVGETGRIIRTTNSGAGWTYVTSGTANDLYGVDAPTSTKAVAVGDNGTVLTSSDAGATWTVRASGVASQLREVSMDRSGNAYAVGLGGTIIRSTDWGATWSTLTSGTTEDLHDVSTVDSTHAFVGGDIGTLRRTVDGSNWTDITPVTAGTYSVVAVNAAVVYASRDIGNALYVSTNGGSGWTQTTGLSTPRDLDLSGEFVYQTQGTTISISTDRGATSSQWADPRNGITDFDVVHDGIGYSSHEIHIIERMDASSTYPDFALGTTDWSHGTSAFGVCLRAVSAGATTDGTTWQPNATCPASDGVYWNGLPATSAAATTVARSLTTGTLNARADLRFGLRTSSNQPAGTYAAQITLEVIAPNA